MHMGAAPAEAMNSGFEELLSIFNENGVRYLIVGGHAVMLAFGATLAGLTAKDFAEEGSFYQMGIPPVRVDILMSIDGVSFAEGLALNRLRSLFVSGVRKDLSCIALDDLLAGIADFEALFPQQAGRFFIIHTVINAPLKTRSSS
jgi:hypothetical protein